MIYCLNDHKTGFALSRQMMSALPVEVETRSFFRFWHDNSPDDKYLIFIRHPYEIITSGYNYHKVCEETWATNNENMLWWWIENHFTPVSVEANREVIEHTNFSMGVPYQTKLNNMSVEEGLKYEMRTVGKLTVMGMYEYPHYDKANVMTIRMEDLFNNYSGTVKRMLEFLELDPNIDLSMFEVNSMDRESIENDVHITNKERVMYKYKEQWTPAIYELADQLFPVDLLEKFNYQK